MSKFFMKPGDTIHWVYSESKEPADSDIMLWSSIMHQYVQIYDPALLIYVDATKYCWINSKGIYVANFNDFSMHITGGPLLELIPIVLTC